jgi:O-antigen biosynthesis protein
MTRPLRALATLVRVTLNWLGLRAPKVTLVPGDGLEAIGANSYRAMGGDHCFTLNVPRQELPGGWSKGWYALHLRGVESAEVLSPKLYVDYGEGLSEQSAIALPVDASGGATSFIRLRQRAVRLRLDPADHPLQFKLKTLELRRVPAMVAMTALALPLVAQALRSTDILRNKVRGFLRIWREGGLEAVTQRIQNLIVDRRDYEYWAHSYDTVDERSLENFRQANERLSLHPRFSILVPVYNTPEKWLRRCLESVLGQTYPHWELCLADDASTAPHVGRVVAEFAARNPRIKVFQRERNGHIAAASNSALSLATGDFVALLDHDDELAPTALYWIAAAIAERPEAILLYSDEDKIDENGKRFGPYFKPDWNPELLCAQNYVNHLGVYRRDALIAAGSVRAGFENSQDWDPCRSREYREPQVFREGFEGSQDWDLLLRVVSSCRPHQIRHIPRVLYHWRSVSGSTALHAGEKSYAADAGVRAVTEFLERMGVAAQVEKTPEGYHRIRYALPDPPPLVSIIIPTRNARALVEMCVESLVRETQYKPYEILLIDNQSDDVEALAYFRALAQRPGIRVLRYDAPFNFSAINNFAAAAANGSVLVLLNNDIEITQGDWLGELVRHAARPRNGVVGAKLLYPDRTIQHAGVIVGFGGVAGHIALHEPRDHAGQMSRCRVAQNLTAVTGACLAVRKSVYFEAGGLDEESLRIAFNDIDFCLKVAALGYCNVWTPHAELIHHESASRGYEDTREKQARFAQEVLFMQRKWGKALQNDPAYNPNLDLERQPFGLSFPPRLALRPE